MLEQPHMPELSLLLVSAEIDGFTKVRVACVNSAGAAYPGFVDGCVGWQLPGAVHTGV